MSERSTQKAAFTIIYNFRNKEHPPKKSTALTRKNTLKRARKLTMDAEELHHERAVEEREQLSANPELSYQECQPERQMQDELEKGIPHQFRDCELEAESPFCSSTRKYS